MTGLTRPARTLERRTKTRGTCCMSKTKSCRSRSRRLKRELIPGLIGVGAAVVITVTASRSSMGAVPALIEQPPAGGSANAPVTATR